MVFYLLWYFLMAFINTIRDWIFIFYVTYLKWDPINLFRYDFIAFLLYCTLFSFSWRFVLNSLLLTWGWLLKQPKHVVLICIDIWQVVFYDCFLQNKYVHDPVRTCHLLSLYRLKYDVYFWKLEYNHLSITAYGFLQGIWEKFYWLV
jgi:hypothetical protein